MRTGRQAGSGTMLVAVVLVFAGLAATVAVVVATALAAAQRVRGAADLVAVSGAISHAAGGDACRAAAPVAAANRVVLQECTLVGDALDFAVTVQVGVPAGSWPLPSGFTATAHAGALATQQGREQGALGRPR